MGAPPSQLRISSLRPITLAALPLAFALIGAAQPAATTLPQTSAAERVKAHMTFLSSDLLEGRDTGSRGHDIAAGYVVSQLQALGLKPGGDKGSWFQQVPYRRATLDGTPTASLTTRGAATPLVQGTDLSVRPNLVTKDMKVNAGLVFVGYGIADPVLGIDNYRGVDARGKIVVAFSGTPKGVPSDIAAHLNQVKAQNAAARGAVGYAEITANPAGNWGSLGMAGTRPVTNWADGKGGSGQGRAAPLLRMSFSKPTAERLFAGARQTLAAVQAEAAAGRQPKGFPLTGTLRVEATSKWEDFTSPNVVAVLPGSDPKLRQE